MSAWKKFSSKLKLSKVELNIYRDIAKEIGLVFFAGWTVGPIATDNFNFGLMVLGLILSLSFWYTTVRLTIILSGKK